MLMMSHGPCRGQDPVANFHLRNGASIAHLHWGADLSSRGRAGSYGIMVNYQCARISCPLPFSCVLGCAGPQCSQCMANLLIRIACFLRVLVLPLLSVHDHQVLCRCRYVLDEVARNNHLYLVDGTIPASQEVRKLLQPRVK